MAYKVHTTSLSTSTKVRVRKSNMVKKQPADLGMEMDYPHTDLPVHWEPPDVQSTPSADTGMELDHPKTDHS